MFTGNKSMTCIAAMAFGFCFFAACGDNDTSTASTFSETDTGKPIAQLDTSMFEIERDSTDHCFVSVIIDFSKTEKAVVALAKTAAEDIAFDSTQTFVPEDLDTMRTLEGDLIPEEYSRMACGGHDDIKLYAKVRGRVLDPSGKPSVNALVYAGKYYYCPEENEECQRGRIMVWTDDEGYFYIERFNFLTYEEGDFYESDSLKRGHIPAFNDIPMFIVSEDEKYAFNEMTHFRGARMVESDSGVIVDVGDIVLQPADSVEFPPVGVAQ